MILFVILGLLIGCSSEKDVLRVYDPQRKPAVERSWYQHTLARTFASRTVVEVHKSLLAILEARRIEAKESQQSGGGYLVVAEYLPEIVQLSGGSPGAALLCFFTACTVEADGTRLALHYCILHEQQLPLFTGYKPLDDDDLLAQATAYLGSLLADLTQAMAPGP